MYEFEQVLKQYEPMISSAIYKCRIFKNHESYRQTARIALWKAWENYNDGEGDFAPYAYTCIRGSILDQLQSENRYAERYQPEQDDIIEFFAPHVIESEASMILEGLLNKRPKRRTTISNRVLYTGLFL